MLLFDISWAFGGFNKQGHNSFKLDVFCRCILLCIVKENNPLWYPQRKETAAPDIRDPEGMLKTVASDTPAAFPPAEVGSGYLGLCLGTHPPPQSLVVELDRNRGLPEADLGHPLCPSLSSFCS